MLLVLCGNSAVGKDTYQDMLLERNKILRRAISHTTRPIRPNEKNGKEYYFTNEKEFLKMFKNREFVETRKYLTFEDGRSSTWHYGLSYNSLPEEEVLITILDHKGAKELIEKSLGVEVKVIYLMADSDVLRERAKDRGDEFLEFERRLKDDKKQFTGIEKIADLMLRTDLNEHEFNLKQIESLFE